MAEGIKISRKGAKKKTQSRKAEEFFSAFASFFAALRETFLRHDYFEGVRSDLEAHR
jgi:hypothetical protein